MWQKILHLWNVDFAIDHNHGTNLGDLGKLITNSLEPPKFSAESMCHCLFGFVSENQEVTRYGCDSHPE